MEEVFDFSCIFVVVFQTEFGEIVLSDPKITEQKIKEEAIELTGTVLEEVRGAFRVKLDNMEHTILCRLAGKMRKFRIRVVPGDRVTVEVSPYDMERGRIVFRER